MSEEKETEDIFLVYVGDRVNVKDKLIPFFLVVTPQQLEEGIVPEGELNGSACRVYTGKDAKRNLALGVGNVFKVPQIKGTQSLYTSKARYVTRWPDDVQRETWQIEHRTETATYAARKAAKKDANQDEFKSLLPYRNQYRKLISRDQRAALLAQIVVYVTGGR